MYKELPFTIGFEYECFLLGKNQQLISAKKAGFPHDADNILVEFRSKPSRDIWQACYSLRAEIAKGVKLADERGYTLMIGQGWFSKEEDQYQSLIKSITREFSQVKEEIKWQNLYGLSPSKKNLTHHAAGLHVSVKKDTDRFVSESKTYITYASMFDFVEPFLAIEKEFSSEIEKSERVKGFYEVKNDGRVEYRSLPTSILDTDFEVRLHKCLLTNPVNNDY